MGQAETASIRSNRITPNYWSVAGKPTNVCELYPTERGHLYQFNYRVVGCMLNDPHPHESIGFDWGSVYCGHEDDPCGAPDFPEPNFDIMFFVDIPPFDSKGE